MRKHKRATIFATLVCAIFLLGYLPAVIAASAAPLLDYFVYLPIVIKQVLPTSIPTNTPAPTQTLTPTPTATSLPNIVAILSSNTYTSSGHVILFGEVRNDTLSNVHYVKVIVSMYDSNNVFVGTDHGYTIMDILKPTQRSPFEILIFDPPANFHHYTLKVDWSSTTTQPLQGLVIVSSLDRPTSLENWHYVYGEVRNDTGGSAMNIMIVVTGYDAQGTFVMYGYGYTSQTELAAGETGPFEILITPWNNPARYELQVQGSRP